METVAEAAVRATLLAAGVVVVLKGLRIRSPRLAHRAWTGLTIVMLLLPALVVWGPTIAVPVLRTEPAPTVAAPARDAVAAPAATPGATRPASAADPLVTWPTVIAVVYLAGVVLLLGRVALGLHRARAIRREACAVNRRLTHPACVTPMTVGLLTPAVILPSDWVSWDDVELAAVLAHEEEHVRRRDPLVSALTLLNRAVFWFHPLAWWLPREIASLAEQACDLAVVARGHDASRYSACLLRFARRAAAARGRLLPVATAMPGVGLPQRLRLLTRPPGGVPSAARLACAALAYSAIVIVCSAATPAAVVSAAAPQGRAPSSPVHTTEHFDIVHDGLTEEQLADAAREAEAAFARLSDALKYDPRERVPLIVVRRDSELRDGDGPFHDLPPGRQRVVISVETLSRRDGTIVHELTHQFAFEIVPDTSRVAPVLIEGLAEHMRGTWNPNDLSKIRDAAATGAVPGVASVSMTDRHWAHALFEFVGAQYGPEGVRRFLFALRAHETAPQAVPMAFGVTLDQFDQAFRTFLMSRFAQR